MPRKAKTPEQRLNALKKIPQARRSAAYTLDAIAKGDKAYNSMMKVSKKAPLMQTKNCRAKRLLKNSTLFTWASGAAAELAAEAHDDAVKLRQDVLPEDALAPYLPTISEGAATEIAERLSQYVQEVYDAAAQIKNGFGKHKKINASCAAAACQIVNARIAAATAPVPAYLTPLLEKKKPAPKKAEAKAVEAA